MDINGHGAIGDVKYSILEPKKFFGIHNKGSVEWILLDGRAITGSQLANEGVVAIPDARGMFIRSLDMGRFQTKGDGTGDPDWQIRNVVEPQSDEFRSHNHSLNFEPTTGLPTGGGETNFANEPFGRTLKLQTVPVGGQETRPKNIALYLYLRIN
ncbi:hypothetical protein WBG78_30560 [Chryseolinea sp. T2]|uniref:hypothetical protein n=1 Tax=Chryseolinea sp. T2 TaxID=3129255 RepID=UPI003077AB71